MNGSEQSYANFQSLEKLGAKIEDFKLAECFRKTNSSSFFKILPDESRTFSSVSNESTTQ